MIENNYHKADAIYLNSIISIKIKSINKKQLVEISTYMITMIFKLQVDNLNFNQISNR